MRMPGTRKTKRPDHPRIGKVLKGPKKKPINVSVREDLVKKAKQLRINISGVVEAAVAQAIREAEQKQWLDENEDAIRYYNAWVKKRGLFSDAWRKF
jgi:antitoxin CcdA